MAEAGFYDSTRGKAEAAEQSKIIRSLTEQSTIAIARAEAAEAEVERLKRDLRQHYAANQTAHRMRHEAEAERDRALATIALVRELCDEFGARSIAAARRAESDEYLGAGRSYAKAADDLRAVLDAAPETGDPSGDS